MSKVCSYGVNWNTIYIQYRLDTLWHEVKCSYSIKSIKLQFTLCRALCRYRGPLMVSMHLHYLGTILIVRICKPAVVLCMWGCAEVACAVTQLHSTGKIMHNFVFLFMKWETFVFQNAARSIVKEGTQARGLCFGDAPASHADRSSVNALCWQGEERQREVCLLTAVLLQS